RKPERGETEIAELIFHAINVSPKPLRPKNLNDVLERELAHIIFSVEGDKNSTPAKVAGVILENGYRKGEK
ncbi:hypothetical protein ABLA76_02090, partial [Xenorhabdus sp. SGI240]